MEKPQIRTGRSHDNVAKKMTRDEFSKQLKKLRDKDAEMVTGVFKNLENPAVGGSKGSVIFPYKAYPGDENVVYEFWDGERYTIPRGVARHLNNNCFYREYQHLQGEFGTQGIRGGAAADGRAATAKMQMSKKVHRFAFHSLEYMDDDADMMPSNLIEVTESI